MPQTLGICQFCRTSKSKSRQRLFNGACGKYCNRHMHPAQKPKWGASYVLNRIWWKAAYGKYFWRRQGDWIRTGQTANPSLITDPSKWKPHRWSKKSIYRRTIPGITSTGIPSWKAWNPLMLQQTNLNCFGKFLQEGTLGKRMCLPWLRQFQNAKNP